MSACATRGLAEFQELRKQGARSTSATGTLAAPVRSGLALGELEALSGLRLAVLLALNGPGVPSEEPALFQHASKVGLISGERPRKAMANGASLARETAAAHGANDIELPLALGCDQGLLQDHLQHRTGEISDVVLAVHRDPAGTLLDPDARDRVLASASRVGAALGIELLLIDTGWGFGSIALKRPQALEGTHFGSDHDLKRSLRFWR